LLGADEQAAANDSVDFARAADTTPDTGRGPFQEWQDWFRSDVRTLGGRSGDFVTTIWRDVTDRMTADAALRGATHLKKAMQN
jgi:hypothetical protein